ncbi:MAG: hypothetical protein WAT22_17815 [Saprospiraceae bacterium]
MKLQEEIKSYSPAQQMAFCENILFQTTVAVRGIWDDDVATSDQKVEAMKWLNEFVHRIHNTIDNLRRNESNNHMHDLLADAKLYGSYSKIASGNVAWILKSASEKMQNQNINSPKKYKIAKSTFENSTSLTTYDEALGPTEEIIFVFEAESYNIAMAIYNQFLGFEQYVPMSETIVCQRDLVISKNGQKLKDDIIVIWQPQKLSDGEWKCDYQIRGIHEGRVYGICGVDSYQAVQEAFKMIDVHLENFRRDHPELEISL